ncbi:GNAT family N-acetyltransferase [Radiobacillus deserti]|uniref:GNAT family N-acetyltransferase n=1 Tax=Radiobacillus deserti TaxID=2594883 RepID=A0A516KIE4_9BACI|nr:GNAT family N-acetyltransferase [Radiobacillus deserti]QDP41151.1 GNAT family N-acetyltransferase [Radiobacillus deserti]
MKVKQTKDYELLAKLNKPVHDLHHSLYPEYFEEYDYDVIKDTFKNQIDKDNFIFLILEDEGEAVGFAWVEIRDYDRYPYKDTYQSVYVHQISINSEKRHSGYGTFLMDHIYQIAKDHNIDLVELDYWVKNSNAAKFYQKHGFELFREMVFKKLEK